ncbi:HAD family hydrolase [Hydrogenimonas sp.]
MKLYYYIDTGHRVGLDRLRRSAPVIRALEELGADVTMLTNDFRAGEYAKEQFGIRRYVSVDVIRNIANIATPADAVVLDADGVGRSLIEDMAAYYRRFVRVSDDPHDVPAAGELLVSSTREGEGIFRADIVDPRYFREVPHTLGDIYFWGDDDYERRLLGLAEAFEDLDITLLEGYYFFFQYGGELRSKFAAVEENEAYDELLKGASRFITSSPQSALEALAAGSNPLYIHKETTRPFWREKLSAYGIPTLDRFDRDSIVSALDTAGGYERERLKPDTAGTVAEKMAESMRL